jgi:hypothetical protein
MTLLVLFGILSACSSPLSHDEKADVMLQMNTAVPQTGVATDLTFTITNPEGNPFPDLQLSHERILHVIVISEDFEEFLHIHPEDLGVVTEEMKEAARFTTRFTPSKAGRYLISTDFANADEHFSKQFTIVVEGSPQMTPVVEDFSALKTFGDYRVYLSSHEPFTANMETSIHYSISKNGQPVTDLQPYLGAPMHFAVVRGTLENFIHTHGTIHTEDHMDHSGHHMAVPEQFGPDLEARIIFPEAGTYHIFGEFKHDGVVIPTHFQVVVE